MAHRRQPTRAKRRPRIHAAPLLAALIASAAPAQAQTPASAALAPRAAAAPPLASQVQTPHTLASPALTPRAAGSQAQTPHALASPTLAPRAAAAQAQTPHAPASPTLALHAAGSQAPAPQAPQQPQAPAAAGGPGRTLTLDDALAIAEGSSEQLAIAQAGVSRADSGEMRAKADLFPQLNVSASYDRTFKSEFADVFSSGPSCTPLTVNPSAPIDARVTEIERALQDCPPSFFGTSGSSSSSDSSDDTSLPFGQANAYRVNLQVTQTVFTAGHITAQRDQARYQRENAGIQLNSTKAQLYLDVAQAYYDAALSDRLVTIAEATLAQAENTLNVTKAQREAGRLSEFDLLRAQVSRNTQEPEVIRRRNARDVAYLRLKQLLDLPLNDSLQLVVNLSDDVLPTPAQRFSSAVAEAEAGAAAARERAAVTEGQNTVNATEAGVRAAHASRLPWVSVNTAYGRVAYPTGLPAFGDWRTNWTAGVGMQWPLFDGGRLKAGELSARADLAEQQARLRLTRELATLDDASARKDLESARAAWKATAGTVEQARRAYEIADLRYREGISTQLELSDSRLLLEQAQAQRAQAARDLQVARVRLALLPDLPLTTTGASTPTQQMPQQAQQQQAAQPAAATQSTGAAAAPASTATGATGGSASAGARP